MQSAQLRDIMTAIYSAIGPKFQQHHFTAQFLQTQRARGVEPFQPTGKLRGVDQSFSTHWIILPLFYQYYRKYCSIKNEKNFSLCRPRLALSPLFLPFKQLTPDL
jgi:hypothetical protein